MITVSFEVVMTSNGVMLGYAVELLILSIVKPEYLAVFVFFV